ncbi:hypothetical protein CSKR_114283 [Clonorchis sinensis]|uniref:Uncharacterized protein n=1 Tax=Clonorchis sinensis TaxID=79923 RepID=A0A3R7CQZ5_CLOSI|nr:hypothetical protein CSKR_114283 [Clonorchis sinensis]
MATNKLYLSYLFLLLMGPHRAQSCEPIPAESKFRDLCSLGGLRWAMRRLSGNFHTSWYAVLGIESCKEACKSQPNCFGFNWWIERSACQLDDSAGSYELTYSVTELYEMNCCGKSVINIYENV